MELDMGVRGQRFVQFLRVKLRERKAVVDGYKDAHFAVELGIEYPTLKRWLASKNLKRIDFDNYLIVQDKYGQELIDFMRQE